LCAEKLGCPIGDANKQAHKKFGEVFDGIYKEYLHNPSEEIAHRTHKELSDWIIGHVLKIDTQIGVCYKKSRARAEKA
jgi:hemerythrin